VLFLRIIDVNLNRLDESLKLIEDITRFHLKNRTLLAKMREIRKNFLQFKQSLPLEYIIGARRSHRDLGRKARFDSGKKKSSGGLILSNLSRAKESSRIIEETLKTMKISLSRAMKDIRFQIYDFEKEIVVFQKRKFDPRLLAIIDDQYLSLADIDKVTNILVKNGATMIQLRIKMLSDRNFLRYAGKIRKATKNTDVKFIINNRLDIALACNADGVHVGQKDIPVAKAREILGDTFIIGASAHNLKEARKAESQGADYLGVGAIYKTKTKHDARVCGLRILRAVCKAAKIPVIGIGGINDKNYRSILKAGASGFAVASFLFEGHLTKRLRSLTEK
jgi:thiamine-phosphate pyrophosphorylase